MSSLAGRTLLDRYQVGEFLGRGGMAEVYKVWDAHRNTTLAMKVLHEDLAFDRVFMRRFQREANTLAQLQHPNIVRFYGLEQDGPLAFMLLDFVDGENLKRLIFEAAGPLPPEQTLDIMRSVCSALQFAHDEGMVHCDIKPGNIMIHGNGTVLVADFGIARMTDAATTTMVGMGTPAYMAPEQISGLDPTPGTDIYALGIVLFEMLTGGERPFTGEHAQTTGSTSEKVRWEHMHLDAPSPRIFNSDLSTDLEAVVLRCLEKEPEQRYASAMELWVALEAATAAIDETYIIPIQAHPAPPEPMGVQQELRTCPYCGGAHPVGAQFCPITGKSLGIALEPAPPAMVTPPAPIIADPQVIIPQESGQAPTGMEPGSVEQRLVDSSSAVPLWKRPAVLIGGGGILILFVFCMCALFFNSTFLSTLTALIPGRNGTVPATSTVEINLITPVIPKPSPTTDIFTPMVATGTPGTVTDTPVLPSVRTDTPGLVTSTPSADRFPICSNVGETWRSPIDGMPLICVPAGEFWMGAYDTDPEAEANEKPGRFVDLGAFWIDQTEVTNAQYEGCVRDGVCRRPNTNFGDMLDGYYGNPQYQNYPVINVNWEDANTYCEWAGRNLPTEAQWEKSARGIDGFTYPWGEGVSCSLANFGRQDQICSGLEMTTRVGSYPEGASPYGALDMAGNAWEWVADWISDDFQSEPKPNCSDSSSVECMVVRGGGWSNDAAAARTTNRTARFITAETSKVGFRCVLRSP